MSYRGSKKSNYGNPNRRKSFSSKSHRAINKSSLMDYRVYEDKERGVSPTDLRYKHKGFDLKEIQEIENKKWEEIRQKEEEGNKLGWNSEKHFEERLKIVDKYASLLKKPDFSKKVYRTMIGHYGGKYVEVPEEYFEEFKAQFPPNEFPKEVRTLDVRDKFTFEGEQHFRSQFPNSNKIKEVFFADRSKGGKRLEYLELPRPE